MGGAGGATALKEETLLLEGLTKNTTSQRKKERKKEESHSDFHESNYRKEVM